MKVFRFPVRVYYEDTDAGGIVYHANYLKFAERARTELVDAIGIRQNDLLDQGRGYAFAVRRMEIDFLKSARLDDRLEVLTSITGLGGASAEFHQRIQRDGVDLATLDVVVAFISLDGKPARIPSDLRASLRELVSERR
jgi:acyl-CoA thioester hydrolase